MKAIPTPLQPLTAYDQFILWTTATRNGKLVKLPIDPRTFKVPEKGIGVTSPEIFLSAEKALQYVAALGDPYGVGFVFTEADPFFFLDLDKCLNPDGSSWSEIAVRCFDLLPGAAVEISQSGNGLHIIGRGECPPHACKNIPLGLELYTENRFVALTGTGASGSAGTDLSIYLPTLVDQYFPHRGDASSAEWTDAPVEGWTGTPDDDALIAKACAARSSSVFDNKASFSALWNCDLVALANSYPDGEGGVDRSSADAALAQHLAFWTGKDCERIKRLMERSGLARDKYEREDYLPRTILRAVGLQESVYTVGAPADNSIAEKYNAPTIRAASLSQREYAEGVRAEKLATATEEERQALTATNSPGGSARFWIENNDKTPAELAAMSTVASASPSPFVASKPQLLTGFQYLGADRQVEHFNGCVYVQNAHKIFTPKGTLLKPDQFNATYGGYTFQLDETGDKTTKKAWEAFTESQVVRFPKAETTCFRPEFPTGEIIEEEGHVLVNVYVPVETERSDASVEPFLRHLRNVLPDERDQSILLSFMAACVQHKGKKFQWAPLLQGVEGNGKTLFTRCVAFAVGQRYTHMPPAAEMSEKFNEWLFHKIFIGIEDVYVPDNKREVMEILKPMITNDRLAMRAMQQSQVMGDNRANFMLNSNHKDAIRKTKNDRRFAVFYTAQQTPEDLVRCGMDGDYFPELYSWLSAGGYAAVNGFLQSFEIPVELNPAGACHRAPETSSQEEVLEASMGSIEQVVLEAIEEGRVGFRGGWVSSVALERLLESKRLSRALPIRRRRELMQDLGYDYHPDLRNGRTNNPVAIDEGKKPRLYVRKRHASRNATLTPADVVTLYEASQRVEVDDDAHAREAFGV